MIVDCEFKVWITGNGDKSESVALVWYDVYDREGGSGVIWVASFPVDQRRRWSDHRRHAHHGRRSMIPNVHEYVVSLEITEAVGHRKIETLTYQSARVMTVESATIN
jgi:hypothetical protein